MKHTFAVVAALAIAATMYATPAYAQTEAVSSDSTVIAVAAIAIVGIISATAYISRRGSGSGKDPVNLQNPTDAENKPSNTKDFDRISADAAQRDNIEDSRDRAEDRATRRHQRALANELNFNKVLAQMGSSSRRTDMLEADSANEVANTANSGGAVEADEKRPGGPLGVSGS